MADSVSADAMHAKNVADVEGHPFNRAESMAKGINIVAGLSDGDLNNFVSTFGGKLNDHSSESGEKSEHNKGTISTKPSAASAVQESVKLAIEELFGDNEALTEDFKAKAHTLFEANLSARVALARETIREEVEAEKEAEIASAMEVLVEQIDEYLTYTANAWRKENEVAITSTLKVEAFEEFMNGLKGLFEAHYISIPDEKVDVVTALSDKVEETNSHLQTAIAENNELRDLVKGFWKKEVLAEASQDLTQEQALKLEQLCETLVVDEKLEEQVALIKESTFKGNKKAAKTGILAESFEAPVEEKKDTPKREEDPDVALVMQAAKLFNR
jgi:hypothetical protein